MGWPPRDTASVISNLINFLFVGAGNRTTWSRYTLGFKAPLIIGVPQALPSSDGRIELTLTREGEDAVIHIKDNGSGIPEENLERIWTPFFTTKSETGMGLGLDICRMIVEQHEGRITCSSTARVGTTMSVYLKAT